MEQQWLSFLVCTAQVPATSRARVRVQSSRSLPLLHRSTFWTPNSPSTAVTLAGSIRDTISARSVKEALGQVSTCREAEAARGLSTSGLRLHTGRTDTEAAASAPDSYPARPSILLLTPQSFLLFVPCWSCSIFSSTLLRTQMSNTVRPC